MVENVLAALKRLFSIDGGIGENGLKPPNGLTFRKYPKRVAIHPTSTMEEKNWPREKFLKLARWLKNEGYEPTFIAAPSERAEWDAPLLPQLEDLASFLYESGVFIGNDSGPGHIASYFGLPYLIIGRQERQMRMWRPGWHPGEIVLPPSWLPNLKGLRLRDEKWKHFITTGRVIKSFKRSVLKN
jgi:ADP-heptose:LPS heptosyltransferase